MSGYLALKVLILDDEPFMRMLLSEMLSNLGLTQTTAYENGTEALAYINSPDNAVDLILLDINMPGMDGIEFVRHLANCSYHGSLILISGEDERMLQTAEKLVKTHNINILGHLQKPVSSAELSGLLKKWLPSWLNESSPQSRKIYSAEEIKIAISNKEFVNYYQPQINVKTGRVVGVEALVRWQHPQDGTVFPDQFIQIAEANGLIDDLTYLVVDTAFAQTSIWQNYALDLRVSVNISMANLASLDFVDYLAKAVNIAGIMSSDIVLEVTETQLMKHLSNSLEVLGRLRLKRFGLSIDDFGTGYSSFALLRAIPFNELKVDRGFVHGVSSNDTLRAIYNASLSVAQQVVAEGVEDWDDWNFLRNSTCNVAQGYFIAKPMPADKIHDWIHDWEANVENFMHSSS
jgi:EAL domain-containing protein (putative c-di-GMP-specific phosphodiesterase class I)/DNA-binding NarL/FixJ family response regulator